MAPAPSLVEKPRQAQGLVAVDRRTFPLLASRIQARAEGGLAATTLVQKYANPHKVPLEVLYILPLPADGAVVGFTIRLGERVVRGEVERREVARERYLKALEEGHTAGLLEQERTNTFTQTLGSLPPGEPVQVEIEILHPLAFRTEAADAGPEWEYRFPTVVGVRYEGTPGRVVDAETLDVPRADGEGTSVHVDLDLFIADGVPEAMAPRSPSHELDVRGEGCGACVALASPPRLDRDIVVRWHAASAAVGAQLVEGRGLSGDDGRYVALTLTPPAVPQATFARDLTLLLDASGSMCGEPLAHAKQIVGALLGSLASGDQFELLSFSTEVTSLTEGLSPATPEKIGRALGHLHALEAGGGTEMRKALIEALQVLRPDSQRQVVLLTDGQIGFEHEVVEEVLSRLPSGSRLHVVGVGSNPNRTLTRGASRAGHGVELLISSSDAAHDAAERVCRATAAPVLIDLVVRGSAVQRIATERPLDVFAGQTAMLAMELRPEGGAIEIEGRLAGGSGPWTHRIQVGPRRGAAEGDPRMAAAGGAREPLPLGPLYARERVEDCEMRLAAAGDDRPRQQVILGEIEKLGLRHRIATRRTSLVAISEVPTVDPRDPRRRERLAVELPAGVSAEGVGLGAVPSGRLHFAAAMPSAPMFAHTRLAQEPSQFALADVPARFDELRVLREELDRLSAEAAHLQAVRDGVTKELEAIEGHRRESEARLRETEARLGELRRWWQKLEHEAAERLAARLEDLRRKESDLLRAVEISGRLTRFTGGEFIVEFEMPEDGITTPDDGDVVAVQWASGPESTERVIGARGTRPGPHRPGLTARLAIDVRGRDSSWRPARLRWREASGRVVVLHIPAGATSPR